MLSVVFGLAYEEHETLSALAETTQQTWDQFMAMPRESVGRPDNIDIQQQSFDGKRLLACDALDCITVSDGS